MPTLPETKQGLFNQPVIKQRLEAHQDEEDFEAYLVGSKPQLVKTRRGSQTLREATEAIRDSRRTALGDLPDQPSQIRSEATLRENLRRSYADYQAKKASYGFGPGIDKAKRRLSDSLIDLSHYLLTGNDYDNTITHSKGLHAYRTTQILLDLQANQHDLSTRRDWTKELFHASSQYTQRMKP